jgi:hypothetical protein
MAFTHELHPRLRWGMDSAVEGGVEPLGCMEGGCNEPPLLVWPFALLILKDVVEDLDVGTSGSPLSLLTLC